MLARPPQIGLNCPLDRRPLVIAFRAQTYYHHGLRDSSQSAQRELIDYPGHQSAIIARLSIAFADREAVSLPRFADQPQSRRPTMIALMQMVKRVPLAKSSKLLCNFFLLSLNWHYRPSAVRGGRGGGGQMPDARREEVDTSSGQRQALSENGCGTQANSMSCLSILCLIVLFERRDRPRNWPKER